MYKVLIALLTISLFSCTITETIEEELEEIPQMYFPPINSDEWETISPDSLNWDTTKLNELYNFLEDAGTRAFIILKNGKIVSEKYWGRTFLNTSDFNQNSTWYWASAGKTLTATLVGIAQQKQMLDINEPTSIYLGEGWTSLTSEQESEIKVWHQLTMTTGLDYTGDLGCTKPQCLNYLNEPGTQWYYHNAPYTLLESVVANVANVSYNDFTDQEIEQKIGMDGEWIGVGDNNVYWSDARSAARFGLLTLNEGYWDGDSILTDQAYFNAMTTTSQDLNPSYGYLWWLNGKDKIALPGFSITFDGSLAPDAPADLYAGMGKNGQYIDVVPSENLVVIRMGEDPSEDLVPVEYHNEIWKKLNLIRN